LSRGFYEAILLCVFDHGSLMNKDINDGIPIVEIKLYIITKYPMAKIVPKKAAKYISWR